jgi:hypothetical protein
MKNRIREELFEKPTTPLLVFLTSAVFAKDVYD